MASGGVGSWKFSGFSEKFSLSLDTLQFVLSGLFMAISWKLNVADQFLAGICFRKILDMHLVFYVLMILQYLGAMASQNLLNYAPSRYSQLD